MLLGALGLVILAMKHLQKPSTIHQIDRVFSPQLETSQSASPEVIYLDSEGSVQFSAAETNEKNLSSMEVVSSEKFPSDSLDIPGLSQVKDKTYFRPAEQQAWFHLIGRLQETSAKDLAKDSLGEISLAQLLKQPDEYRGRVISLLGTALREEIANPGENSLGLESYHRLWIQPLGGGNIPFVVYCLTLPESFPRGDKIKAPLNLSGYFFKNWSYSWDEGLALAPILVTKTINWQPPSLGNPSNQTDKGNLAIAIVAASIISLLFAWLAYKNTQRPNRNSSAKQTKIPIPSDWQEGRES